jgi:hypothetical protein
MNALLCAKVANEKKAAREEKETDKHLMQNKKKHVFE